MNREEKKKLRAQTSKKNKWILGSFLAFIFLTIALRVIDGILLDFGFYDGKFNVDYFRKPEWVQLLHQSNLQGDDLIKQKMIIKHPNVAWIFTQFTWITTFVVLIIIFFRFFKYDDDAPRWLKWTMSQRTLSLVTMYDSIVCVVFWSSMFKNFNSSFNPSLKGFEQTITIFVHAIIPIFMIIYSSIYMLRDKKASFLKEGFILKGMIFPIIYSIYYVVVAVGWEDPYAISNLHNNFTGEIWKFPVGIFGIYILLGLMLVTHNLLLLKFNPHYNYENDYEIQRRMRIKTQKHIEKLKRKERRKLNYAIK